ncbi:hypothetical protein [Sphingomonas sp. Leaf25]|uniref:hypothetical protein n=1 Tax=Sphingomonas sp. Leaf25 TaxID=1735692 RepID=UPI000ADF23C6|nr:hypothetical protein [Sphingomonas sp. Leaf25]
MRTRLFTLFLAGGVLLNGCARKTPEAVAAPPVPPVAAVPQPMPKPPLGAAANLAIPAATPDGGYATINRTLSTDAALWHLRSALNVAALQCDIGDPNGVAQYNRLLKVHAARFAAAHRALEAEYRRGGGDWQDRFDDSMTRVYNYFAQPPVRARFCATALPMLAQVADLPAGSLDGFAAPGLGSLDEPFVEFYRAYDAYRIALAQWQAGQGPKLAVDPQILVASTEVTGGSYRVAAR